MPALPRSSPAFAALCLLLSMLAPAVPAGAAFSLEASLDAAVVGEEDILQYTITARGTTISHAGEPTLPDLQGFQILGRSRGTSLEVINGRTSTSVSWTFSLAPPAPGEYVFEPATLDRDGREYRSNRVKVTVQPGSLNRRPRTRPRSPWDPLGQKAQGRHSSEVLTDLSRDEAYVGETVVLTYRLQTTMRLVEAQPTKAAEFPGFLVHEHQVTGRGKRIGEKNGFPLYEHVLGRYVLIPLEAGKKGIPAHHFQLSFRIPDDSWGLGLFDRKEQIRGTAKARVVQVHPVPEEGMPHDYGGAVGRFEMEGSISGNRGQVGEAVNLRLSLSGTGNFPQLGPPELPDLPGFKIYEPRTRGGHNVTPDGLSGERIWEYVLVPEQAGPLSLPAVRFSYFDPQAHGYRTTRSRPLQIEVVPAPPGGPPDSLVPGPPDGASPAGRGLYLRPLEPASPGPPVRPLETLWFWLLAALPLAWLLAAVAARARSSGREERDAKRRVRRALARATARIRAAIRLGEDRAFYAEIDSAVSDYFTDKADMPPASLTRDAARRMLDEGGVEPALLEELEWVRERCNYLRFTPDRVEESARRELMDRAVRLLRSLDRYRAPVERGGSPRAAVFLVACLLGWAGAALPAPASDGSEAVSAYNRGQFEEAVRIYRDLLGGGNDSAALHHNLAVALHRTGENGLAVLHFERALGLDPFDGETRRQLAFLRQELGQEAPPGAWLDRLLAVPRALLPPLGLAGAFLGLWWLAAAALAWRLVRPESAWPRPLLVAAGALFLVAALLLAVQLWSADLRPAGVLLQPTRLRSGPSVEFSALAPLEEGAACRIRRSRDGWLQVSIPGGASGWVPASAVGRV